MSVIDSETGAGRSSDPSSRSSRPPRGLASKAAWVKRSQPEMTALALVVLWLGLEIAWRWRRLRAWIG